MSNKFLKTQKHKEFNFTKKTVVLIALSVILCVTGFFLGDTKDIMRKAIFICMECIGLG